MSVLDLSPVALRSKARSPRRISITAAVSWPVAATFAFFPSYLPHQPITAGVVLALAWLTVYAVVRRVRTWAGPRLRRHDVCTERTRRLAMATSALTLLAVSTAAAMVQNTMRDRIGMARLDPVDALTMGAAAVATLGAAVTVAWVWRWRSRWWRPATAVVIAGMLSGAGYPAAAEGTGAASAQEQVLRQPATQGAVRAYATLADAPDVSRRADLAVARATRAGAMRRDHLVLVLPTGSGWVNPHLVTGLEQRFGSEVATVSMQYDDRPSWVAFLFGRNGAESAAAALLDAATRELRSLPAADRPQLHVVGESLGALAGQSVFERPGGAARREEVCSTMWVGTPGGEGVDAPQEVLMAHSDDPVVHADPSMVLAPPGDGRPWLPVVSGVQAFTDFIGSLAVPTGAGHRYGPGQAARLPTC